MFTGGGDRLRELIKLNPYGGVDGDIWFVAAPIAAAAAALIIIIIVYSLISCYFKKKKLKIVEKELAVADYQFSVKSTPFDAANDDAKFAEQLQVEEAIFASMLYNPSSSSSSSSSSPPHSLSFNKNHDNNPEKTQVCNICFENHENWKMFINSTCPHSFCYECITKHTTTKIHQKNNQIPCPEFTCNSALDSTILRLIIPKQIMNKWDELLCEFAILEYQKLYCPFGNCSALLINDDATVTKVDCPVCRRAICAVCRVPWHSEFTCREFGKLSGKKKGEKDEKMTEALAKKKKWKKCRKCGFFVEKTEGCLHITCRCGYEFCYGCGAKWSANHGGCGPKT